MTPFSKFLYLNEISKKTIAEYLGVSGSFVTQLCSGARTLSEARVKQLQLNPEWDCSPLIETSGPPPASSSPASATTFEQELAKANARIEYLESQIERLQRICDEYWATIRKFLEK